MLMFHHVTLSYSAPVYMQSKQLYISPMDLTHDHYILPDINYYIYLEAAAVLTPYLQRKMVHNEISSTQHNSFPCSLGRSP